MRWQLDEGVALGCHVTTHPGYSAYLGTCVCSILGGPALAAFACRTQNIPKSQRADSAWFHPSGITQSPTPTSACVPDHIRHPGSRPLSWPRVETMVIIDPEFVVPAVPEEDQYEGTEIDENVLKGSCPETPASCTTLTSIHLSRFSDMTFALTSTSKQPSHLASQSNGQPRAVPVSGHSTARSTPSCLMAQSNLIS